VPTADAAFGNVGAVDEIAMNDLAPVRLGQAIYSSRGVVVKGYKVKVYDPSAQVAVHGGLSREDVQAVEDELKNPDWDFRRPSSIGASTGLPVDVVAHILKTRRIARRPWGRPAAELFTRADRPVSLRERLSLFGLFLAKRP
jgi:hypothetical protein